MAINKADAIEQLKGPNSISNQQALVKKIQGTQKIVPVRYPIPGGKTMTQDIPESQLSSAVYNWLRHCRHFMEAKISLINDLNNANTTRTKVIEFNSTTKNAEWEVRGKKWLAERVSDVLKDDHIVAVEITKEGIFAFHDNDKTFSPDSEDWEPYVEMLPFRAPTF